MPQSPPPSTAGPGLKAAAEVRALHAPELAASRESAVADSKLIVAWVEVSPSPVNLLVGRTLTLPLLVACPLSMAPACAVPEPVSLMTRQK
mmetsp:Transcript_7208/g.23089  ORF Transcript_7208/g.23089 Transcript_7208/m.23089 type:complete len:91 (+) Transcript_7208:220-492(+)